MQKSKLMLFFMASILLFSACNAGNNGEGGMQTNSLRQRDAADGTGNLIGRNRTDLRDNGGMNGENGRQMHQNTKMRVSDHIAEQLSAMDGVEQANVLTTDQNVYVAVVLEDNNAANGNGMNGTMQRIPRQGRNGDIQRDTRLYGNDHSMGDYGTNEKLPDQMKNRIADKVKSLYPECQHVYVSANADFGDRLNGYVDQIQAGEPIEGFVEEFNVMMQRIFPAETGTRDDMRMERQAQMK